MPSYREDGEFGKDLAELLPRYKNKTDVLQSAVDLLHWMEFSNEVTALALDLDLSHRDVLILAVAQLWQREIGEPDRDVLGELDEVKARLDKAGL